MREIIRVIDLVGPRGGTTLVVILDCEHWHTRKKLPMKMIMPCMGCLVAEAMKKNI